MVAVHSVVRSQLVAAFAAVLLLPAVGPADESNLPRTIAGSVAMHAVQQGETLASIGARAGVDAATLASDNGLDVRVRLVPGQSLQIDNRHIVPAAVEAGTLVVNVPQRMLFAASADGRVEAYPVAVGRRDWPTPTREFIVTVKETHPTWDVPVSIQEESRRLGRVQPSKVPPGPNNPLGAFWIGLSLPGVGIHGTNAPSSIFRVTTHGCIRLHPEDIARLFPNVTVGMPGRTVYEPLLVAIDGSEVYLEVHRDAYRRLKLEPALAARALAERAGVSDRIDWTIADAVVRAHEGVARLVTVRPITEEY